MDGRGSTALFYERVRQQRTSGQEVAEVNSKGDMPVVPSSNVMDVMRQRRLEKQQKADLEQATTTFPPMAAASESPVSVDHASEPVARSVFSIIAMLAAA